MLLQCPDARNGGAAGGADSILQCAGVIIGGQRQLRRAQQHLGGVALGLGTGQSCVYRAVRQSLQEQVSERAAAAGHGAARVHQLFLQLLRHLADGTAQRQQIKQQGKNAQRKGAGQNDPRKLHSKLLISSLFAGRWPCRWR